MFAEHKRYPTGTDDLVNYARLVTPGVVQLKDGAFLVAYHYAGPDLDLATPEELEHLSAQGNAACIGLGSGWMMHVDEFLRETREYLPHGAFPDPISRLIDDERRAAYTAAGAHYQSVQAMALTYLPSQIGQEVESLLTSTGGEEDRAALTDQDLMGFLRRVEDFEDRMRNVLTLERMGNEALLTYLHACVTGNDRLVRYTREQDLDALIADEDLVGGFYPMIGERHTRAVSVTGYPFMLGPNSLSLRTIGFPVRASIRFIFCDRVDAEAIIARKQKYWEQQVRSIGAKAGEMFAGASSQPDRYHPLQMVNDANEAAADAASGAVLYGHHTVTVIVQDEDRGVVQEKAREVKKHIERCGFGARIEKGNSLEALIGSWPGHGYQNVRKEFLHTLNLVDMLPLTSIWLGLPVNPNPLFPANSPALMLTATAGGTPFWFTPYIHQVGNAAILGPIRSGKSFLLALWLVQFRRYQDARIIAFDRGYSAAPICLACSGHFHDIGQDTTAFAPLANVDDPHEREWALGYVETLLKLQRVLITAEQRSLLWRALTLMGERNHNRTISGLCTDLQDVELRHGLRHYTVDGGAGSLLDAERDTLKESDFHVFEIEHLMGGRPREDLLSVLLYLFHWVDRQCQDGRPTLIAIDEAWKVFLDKDFSGQLNDWLRGKPKQNAAVVLATQSLQEVVESGYHTIIEQSCQTKIFLPDSTARNENSAALYRKFGLNERKIERLAEMVPRREYLYTSPYGAGVFDLQAGAVAKAFCGVTDRAEIARIFALAEQRGKEWPYEYLDNGSRHPVLVDVTNGSMGTIAGTAGRG